MGSSTAQVGVVPHEAALIALRYSFPIAMFAYFLLSSSVAACLLRRKDIPSERQTVELKKLVLRFGLGIIGTYFLQCFLAISRTLAQRGWWTPQHEVVYYIASIISWGALQLALTESTQVVWQPYYGCWAIANIFEIALLGISSKGVSQNRYDAANIAIVALRVILVMMLPASFFLLRWKQEKYGEADEERALLSDSASDTVYGSSPTTEDDSDNNSKIRERIKKKVEESGNWWNYTKTFAILWPMVWPGRDRKLQFIMGIVGIIFVVERGLNVLVPHQLGKITDALATGNGQLPWSEVLLFVVFRFLNSDSGLSALQGYLWIPIDQYSYKSISTKAYNHVMSLSYDFHSEKKSGELYSAVSSGRTINWFVEMMIFNFFPMMADVAVAFVYFYVVFDAYMALIVSSVLVTYIYLTMRMGRYKESVRREYVAGLREETNLMWETLGSWQTVTYFNRAAYEQGRYTSVIEKVLRAARKWQIGMTLLKGSQSLILTVGLLSACFLAVYQISSGARPVGVFVTLLTYWGQLSGPLSFFGSFMRQLQTTMIDAEKLLELLQTKPTVKDSIHATPLQVTAGEVVFNDVDFEYDERKATISGVTFTAKPGQTIAIVGETGAGKTTLLKLLFRFYDIKSGFIEIDGQNIKDVTLASLRENLGVVPQDPSLFNDTIMNNLKYANFDASEDEVYAACRAAAVHEKILSFPDGYSSKVGERGVKLSGGELQRVAIARAILKDPKIVLLDEATSMVDLETEQQIQEAFKNLAENRTTFVVAHRLSTIMNAHQILVLNGGKIIESGTHETLLAAEGKYFSLWTKHVKNESQGRPDEAGSAAENPPTETKKVNLSEGIKEITQSGDKSDLSEVESSGVAKSNSSKVHGSAVKNTHELFEEDSIARGSLQYASNSQGEASKATPSFGLPLPTSKELARSDDKQYFLGAKPSLPKIRTSNLKPDAPEYVPAALRNPASVTSPASPVLGSASTLGPDTEHSAAGSSQRSSPLEITKEVTTEAANIAGADINNGFENVDQKAGKGKRAPGRQRYRQKGSRGRKELSNVSNEIEGQDTATAGERPNTSDSKKTRGNNAASRRRVKQKGSASDIVIEGELASAPPCEVASSKNQNKAAPPAGSAEEASSNMSTSAEAQHENPHRPVSEPKGTGRRVHVSGNIKDKLYRRQGQSDSAKATKDIHSVPAEAASSSSSGLVGKDQKQEAGAS